MKRYRKGAGITQEALAERCGVAANYISQIEMGRRFPLVELIERIARSLEIEAYLLFRKASEDEENREFLSRLPEFFRKKIKKTLLGTIDSDIDRALDLRKPK